MPTELEGFDEFQRDTNKIEREFPNAMREAAEQFARDWVSAAQAMANTDYAHEAASQFVVASDGDGATIENNSPVFFGSEFGGQARPETMQFPPHNGRRGYWFYPARRENEERLNQLWDKGVEAAMREWDRHG